MKIWVALAVVLALVGFMGLVVWSTLQGAEVECVVCMEFDGEEVCRAGRGPSEPEARQAAQESVCGGNVSGMAEIIACRNAQPESAQCTS